jgi:hypothetical protein
VAGKDPHGPNRLSNYFNVHEQVMRGLVDRGFVLDDGVAVTPLGNGTLLMEGTITCLGNIEVTVEKILQVTKQPKGEPVVQTIDYHYNARVRGVGNVLRYDYPHPDHNRFHHVHRYDVFNGDEDGSVEACEWPTLGQVLDELEEWYYENRENLHRIAG